MPLTFDSSWSARSCLQASQLTKSETDKKVPEAVKIRQLHWVPAPTERCAQEGVVCIQQARAQEPGTNEKEGLSSPTVESDERQGPDNKGQESRGGLEREMQARAGSPGCPYRPEGTDEEEEKEEKIESGP